MHLRNYEIHDDHVVITYRSGRQKLFHFTAYSGRAFFRYKLGTGKRVKHTGIFLGIDKQGKGYFIHNHIVHGHATIVNRKEFAKGLPIHALGKESENPPERVMQLALEQVKEGHSYHVLKNNCQTLTNWSCHNSRHSEDVNKWASISGIGISLLAVGVSFLLKKSGS